MDKATPKESRWEFAGSVLLGAGLCFAASAATAFMLVSTKKWGASDLDVALRWSAVLAVGLLLILAAWRKVAPKLPPFPRAVIGMGLGMLITVTWALFARDQYGRLWNLSGAPLI